MSPVGPRGQVIGSYAAMRDKGRFNDDPYPMYQRLLAKAPIHLLPEQQLYVVVGFEAIRHVDESR